jgi:nitric oxide reductase NorD protein
VTGGPDRDRQQGSVRAADIHRVLALFAQGLAGRNLLLKPNDDLEAAGRESVIGTDGDTIGVPTEIAAFTSARHNFGAYLVTVLHQVGQLEFGTFDFSVEHDFDVGPDPWLLRVVFVTLEDRRIDLALRRRYPGATADLDRVRAHARSSRPSPATLPLRDALIEVLVQYSLGAKESVSLPGDTSGVGPRMLRLAAVVESESASARDSARAALAICALFDEVRTGRPRSHKSDDDMTIEIVPASEDSSPGESGGGRTDAERDAHGLPTDELDGPGVELQGTLTGESLRERAVDGRPGTLPDQFVGSVEPTVPTGETDGVDRSLTSRVRLTARQRTFEGDRIFLYDEWDHTRQNYLEAWCQIHEHRLRGDDHEFLAGVRRRHADLAHRVRRTFRSVKPESWHRVHSMSDGEELDLDAVITAMVDRRAGHVTEEHFYVRRERARREVAAAFLLDISASTSSPLPDPDAASQPPRTLDEDEESYFHTFSRDVRADADSSPPERRVLDIAKDAIGLMGDALQILGDEHAIYGFSGEGRDNVEFYVAKEFRDAPSARAWAGLAAMEPRRYTRMGPAIRHAATKLVAQPARTKVLIVVSDGYPQDKDYGPTAGDKEYGLHDTARALQEAERAGISTFCVTVDPAGHDYLRTMCAADRYLVIDDVTALPQELSKIYRALTAARSRTPGD